MKKKPSPKIGCLARVPRLTVVWENTSKMDFTSMFNLTPNETVMVVGVVPNYARVLSAKGTGYVLINELTEEL